MAPTSTRRSSSLDTSSSRSPTSMQPSPGLRAAPRSATGSWRSAPSGSLADDTVTTAGRDEGPGHRAAEAVARRSYGKLVALLATETRDVEAAEDALGQALLSALAGILAG